MRPDVLKRRLMSRRDEARRIETAIIDACERAASRACRRRALPADPCDWPRAAWEQYLLEAKRLDQRLGPRLRAIRSHIDALERISAQTLAA